MLRVIELFAGIGSQTQALKNIGVDHEVVAIAEIDKFAIKSYEAIHGEKLNLGDVSTVNVDDIPNCDLLTYSFPCQDISVSGDQRGLDKGSNTRSSLLWECERIIKAKRPKYLLLENVKNLVGKKHKPNFDKWLETLESIGYNNYWQVINAKDYGIPQNRERVFVVSILKEFDNGEFEFPKEQELTLCLKDLLEQEVDEKFYLSKEMCDRFVYKPQGECVTVAGEIDGVNFNQTKRVIDPNGVCSTVDTMGGGNRQPKILEVVGELDAAGWYDIERRVYSVDKCSPTLDTRGCRSKFYDNFRIRKLTPLECWRLMGFSDDAFYKVEKVNSNTQLYKQAGNSIVVPVLEGIFRNMLEVESE